MRWVLRILGGLLLLVVLAVAGVAFYLNQIASTAIEKGGTRALGVQTSVSGVLLRPIGGSARIFGLEIANPPGFDAPHFLTLGHAVAQLDTGTLRSDTIEITQIRLEEIGLDLERRGGKLNTDALLAHMRGSSRSAEPEPAQGGGAGPRVVVRDLRIRDVTAHVDLAETIGKYGRIEVNIPEIRLRDIGDPAGGGADLAQLTEVVVAALLGAVAKHGAALPAQLTQDLVAGLGRLGNVPYQVVGDVTGGLLDASGRLVETTQGLSDVAAGAGEASKRAAEGVKGVTEGLKGASDALGGLLERKRDAEE